MLPTRTPLPNPETQRFWDASTEGRIELPRCDACGLVVWYPRAVCPDCQSTAFTWETMAGTGTVYSFTVVHAGVGRAWREHVPFVVAYVRLDDGPTLLTNIVECDPADVHVDMAVTAVFDHIGDGTGDGDAGDGDAGDGDAGDVRDVGPALVRFRPA